MSHRNKIAAVCVAVTMAGCGGGGGGGSDSSAETAKPASPTPSTILTLSESSEETRTLPDAFAAINGAVSVEGDLLAGSLASGTLTLNVGEVDRPTETTADVVNSNGKTVATIQVLIENTSADPVVQTLELLESHRTDLLALSDLKALHKMVVDTAYLASAISATEQDTLLAQFSADQLPRFNQAETSFDETLAALKAYKAGTVGDDQLNPDALISELDYLAQEGHALVVSAAQSLSSPLTIPQNFTLQVDADAGVVSRFIGQADLGSVTDGEWTYTPSYQHLSLIQ